MEKYRILLRSAMKKQAGSIAGLLLMVFVSVLCLFTAVTVYGSGKHFVAGEMERLGFGDLTVWVSDCPDEIISEIENVYGVERVMVQLLLFAGYEINGRYSDNDGQLIVYDIDSAGHTVGDQEDNGNFAASNIMAEVPYRFLDQDGNYVTEPVIEKGTVYISPAMRSSFDVEIGDTIQFELARSNGIRSLTVAGYFEDAFMGSSMIDMKSFLICGADREEFLQVMDESPKGDAQSVKGNTLAKDGAMFHIFRDNSVMLEDVEFQEAVLTDTGLPLYTEFTYGRDSILSYMLLLQNILCGFLIVFSAVLLVICLIVAGKSLSDVVEQDKKDMAVLKTIGLSGDSIQSIYFGIYGGVSAAGIVLGMLLSMPVSKGLANGMVTSTGMLIRIEFPFYAALIILAGLLVLFGVFLHWRTGSILRIAPIQAIRESTSEKPAHTRIRKRFLVLGIAVRELTAHKGKYVSVCVIAALLVFFLSVIGRMGAWLGTDGEGLMNAFSVADHDLGVQPFQGDVPMEEIERIINWYSPIEETYELAMESVTINGVETTANVLNDTGYFHVLEGEVCDGEGVLITHTIANELGLEIGDDVRIAGNGRMESYTVSGIYQCANGMGNNIGMSMAGYSKIGNINGFIWCYHYILKDGTVRDYAMKYLQDSYRGIDVHTNSWSGLDGIVSLMHGVICVIYLVAAVFILIAVSMSTDKLLRVETGNMAVYKSLGLSDKNLRLSFSIRFLLVAAIGALIGSLTAFLSADAVIRRIFRLFGIGQFTSRISLAGTFLPFTVVILLFFGFVWLFSARLKQVSIVKLLVENED